MCDFTLRCKTRKGPELQAPKSAAASAKELSAVLVVEREYQPGDRIIFGGPQRMAVRVDEHMPECLLYLAPPLREARPMRFPTALKRSRRAAPTRPESFAGKSHRVAVRALISAS